MAEISSHMPGERARHDMRGRVREPFGATFEHDSGQPHLWLRIQGDDGRAWDLKLTASETQKLAARFASLAAKAAG